MIYYLARSYPAWLCWFDRLQPKTEHTGRALGVRCVHRESRPCRELRRRRLPTHLSPCFEAKLRLRTCQMQSFACIPAQDDPPGEKLAADGSGTDEDTFFISRVHRRNYAGGDQHSLTNRWPPVLVAMFDLPLSRSSSSSSSSQG